MLHAPCRLRIRLRVLLGPMLPVLGLLVLLPMLHLPDVMQLQLLALCQRQAPAVLPC